VPETRRLQTCAARKGRILPKETVVKRRYEGGGPGLHVPSRNTGRGVYSCGEPKGYKPVSIGKPTRAQPPQGGQAQGLKGPGVTAVQTRNQTI
jgi:hypothetical protein